MRRGVVFCSACDRNVPVLVKRELAPVHPPSTRDLEETMTCLDHGVRCTGSMCPLFDLPIVPLRGSGAERRRAPRERSS